MNGYDDNESIPDDDIETFGDGQEFDESETDETDPDDESEDGSSEEESEEEESEEEETEAEDGTPEGVKRRFATLTKKRREAEARVTELQGEVDRLKQATGQDSPKVYLALAQKHGILPELTDAATAKALSEMGSVEQRVDFLRDTLDEMDDDGTTEVELGGHNYSRGELRKELRKAERRLDELRDDFGDAGKRLRERTVKLLQLGLAAEKAAKARGGSKKKELTKRREPVTKPKVQRPAVKPSPRKRSEDPRAGLDRILNSFVK